MIDRVGLMSSSETRFTNFECCFRLGNFRLQAKGYSSLLQVIVSHPTIKDVSNGV